MMRPSKARTWIGWALLVLAPLGLVSLSCDPETIAPLPTPETPDGDRILLSSLTVAEDVGAEVPGLVAMVGLPGAVEGTGEVRLHNARSGESFVISSTAAGTFTTSLMALPGDPLEVRFAIDTGAESEPAVVAVGKYDEERAAQVNEVPTYAGDDWAYEKNDHDGTQEPPPCEGEPDCPDPVEPSAVPVDCPEEGPCAGAGPEGGELDAETEPVDMVLVWTAEGGVLRLKALTGTFTASSTIVVMNSATGTVQMEVAGSDGDLDAIIDAQPGQILLVFAQAADDPKVTTPAVELTVPKKDAPQEGSGGSAP